MSDAHDIFSAFFGGGGRRKPTGPRKGEDLVHPIQVTLENLYNGKQVKLALTRNLICSSCNGSGRYGITTNEQLPCLILFMIGQAVPRHDILNVRILFVLGLD
jgi:DnaJ-class molecular chaperone